MKKSNDFKMERYFKGVWIPKEIYLNKELSLQEKFLLIEVDSLSKLDVGCFASNDHFTEILGVAKKRISEIISSLVEKGYLEREVFYKENSKEIEKRVLFISYEKFKG